ncbi:MAG: hypothetical protein AB7S80_06380 [Rhizobiaceae bacterium]
MNALTPILLATRWLSKFNDLRKEMRTRRTIAALPRSIQKDIGWPDGYAGRQLRR